MVCKTKRQKQKLKDKRKYTRRKIKGGEKDIKKDDNSSEKDIKNDDNSSEKDIKKDDTTHEKDSAPTEDKQTKEIMKEVNKENDNLAKNNIVTKTATGVGEDLSNAADKVWNATGNIVSGLTINAAESLGEMASVDIANSKDVGKKLDEIKESITTPENQEKMKEIIGEYAEIGGIAVEASAPFIDPLVDTASEKMETIGSKLGSSAVKIGLNTIEEIPFYGILVGTARSLSTAGDAAISTVNATNEIIKTTADSVNGASKNFNQLMNERKDITGRTSDQINKFVKSSTTNKSDKDESKETIKKSDTDKKEKEIKKGGNLKSNITNRGTRRSIPFQKNKTKRVRFAL